MLDAILSGAWLQREIAFNQRAWVNLLVFGFRFKQSRELRLSGSYGIEKAILGSFMPLELIFDCGMDSDIVD